MSLIPGLGRSVREGNGNSLQYSCLGNPTGKEEPGGLQCMGLQRVRQDLTTKQQLLDFPTCYLDDLDKSLPLPRAPPL